MVYCMGIKKRRVIKGERMMSESEFVKEKKYR
jgi:hypothetical protein